MANQSPLKDKPLRNPGESLDIEIDKLVSETATGYVVVSVMLCFFAGMEWLAVALHSPRQPILFSVMAMIAVGVSVWQLPRIRWTTS